MKRKTTVPWRIWCLWAATAACAVPGKVDEQQFDRLHQIRIEAAGLTGDEHDSAKDVDAALERLDSVRARELDEDAMRDVRDWLSEALAAFRSFVSSSDGEIAEPDRARLQELEQDFSRVIHTADADIRSKLRRSERQRARGYALAFRIAIVAYLREDPTKEKERTERVMAALAAVQGALEGIVQEGAVTGMLNADTIKQAFASELGSDADLAADAVDLLLAGLQVSAGEIDEDTGYVLSELGKQLGDMRTDLANRLTSL